MTEPRKREGVPTGHGKLSRRTVIIGAAAFVAAGGVEGLWWLNSPHPLSTYRGHTDAVNAVAWSPDGKCIASGGDDKTVQVWNAADSTALFTCKGHFDEVSDLVWKLLASKSLRSQTRACRFAMLLMALHSLPPPCIWKA